MRDELSESIFNIEDHPGFFELTREVFEFQYGQNKVYRDFIESVGPGHFSLERLEGIPFIPIEFFRDHTVTCGNAPGKIIFKSSGTTGMVQSKHHVVHPWLYEKSFMTAFEIFYGSPRQYIIIALLPSYTEREGSSLVYMADRLIKESGNSRSGFYREKSREMNDVILNAKSNGQKVLLLGVSFALLDLAEEQPADLSGVIVMETGGMKGRRKEITRGELHDILKKSLNVETVHSEYGMTELLSQAYSSGNGLFRCPPWMKVLIRDPEDPLTIFTESGKTGGINIIDLANMYSCSFISTGDLGRMHDDGSFEVLGRFDNSDVRGCNLLVE